MAPMNTVYSLTTSNPFQPEEKKKKNTHNHVVLTFWMNWWSSVNYHSTIQTQKLLSDTFKH